MYYIEQLKAYHQSKGLVGEALEKAVEDDKQRVIENVKSEGEDISFIGVLDELSMLFVWENSQEGHQYWFERDEEIRRNF